MFEFANIWVFVLLPLPFLVYWLLPALHSRSDTMLVPFLKNASEASGEKLRKKAWVSKRNFLQWIFLVLIWISFLISLARPQITGQAEMKIKTVRSFVVAADISFSMANRDWVLDGERLSRWEAIKSIMSDFIEKREGDRMAMVFFGTNAYLQTPFTTDLEVVDWFLEETEVGMAGQMTSIGKAIGFSIRLFEQDSLDQKVILLLTDGKDGGQGISPVDAAYVAKKDSIKIYTLGIGDPNASGSDLDENTLINISSITEGRYFRAMDTGELEKAYEEIDQLEPMEFEEEENKPVTTLYHYPLIVSLLLSFLLIFIRFIVSIISRRRSG